MPLRTLGAVCAACMAGAPAPAIAADPATPSPDPQSTFAGAQRTTAAPVDHHMLVLWRLADRQVRLASRAARLRGERMSAAQRSLLRAMLERVSSAAHLRRMIRSLRREIRDLRRRLTARSRVLAPEIAIPAALATIARCESGGNPRAVSGGGAYRGKYQFSLSTWRSVGGRGDPALASEAEQDRRAAMLYRRDGARHWPVCGR